MRKFYTNKKIAFALSFLLLTFISATAQKELEVNSFSVAPVIDGAIDPQWDSKPWVQACGLIQNYVPQEKMTSEGYFKLGWKDNTLFVLIKIAISGGDPGVMGAMQFHFSSTHYVWNTGPNVIDSLEYFLCVGNTRPDLDEKFRQFPADSAIEIPHKKVVDRETGDIIYEGAIDLKKLCNINITEGFKVDFNYGFWCDNGNSDGSYTKLWFPSRNDVQWDYGFLKFVTTGEPVVINYSKFDCSVPHNGSIDLSIEGGTAPYTILWSDGQTTQDISNLIEGSYTVTVTDAKNISKTESIVIAKKHDTPSTTDVYEFENEPVIDGIIDEAWNINQYQIIEKSIKAQMPDPNDISGKFKVGWHNNVLYFLIVAKDDSLILNEGVPIWLGDNVNLYLDLGNEKASTYDLNDHLMHFKWGNTTYLEKKGDNELIRIENSPTGIDFAQVIDKTNHTYTMEIALRNLSELHCPQILDDGYSFGLDLLLDDTDDRTWGDDALFWASSTGAGWRDPSVFGNAGLGTMSLKSAKVKVDTKTVKGLSIYPTIVSNNLNIVSSNNANVEIINLLGEKVLIGKVLSGNSVLNLSSLSNGIYLVNVIADGKILKSQKVVKK